MPQRNNVLCAKLSIISAQLRIPRQRFLFPLFYKSLTRVSRSLHLSRFDASISRFIHAAKVAPICSSKVEIRVEHTVTFSNFLCRNNFSPAAALRCRGVARDSRGFYMRCTRVGPACHACPLIGPLTREFMHYPKRMRSV